MSPAKSPKKRSARDSGKKDKLVVEKVVEEELPPGWKVEMKTRKGSSGKKRDRYYTDPVTGYVFRSLADVQRYLKTGKVGRLAKKPKNTETDDKMAEVGESKEKVKSETVSNKPPLEDGSVRSSKSSETRKSESPQRSSKRLAGVTIDAPLPPPSPPEPPKTRKATRLSGVKIDAPPPPPPPEPKTCKATQSSGIKIDAPPQPQEPETRNEPPPPPPLSSPPVPKTSHQVTTRQAEEAQTTRPTVVLAIPKEKDKKAETDNAGMAAKSESLAKANKDKSKADENKKSHTPATLAPVSHPTPVPPPTIVQEKQELGAQESCVSLSLKDFWTDPCIEFAVKTLTGAIPYGDLNDNDINKAADASALEVPMEELWTDPCIEFAVKTLTGAIPVGEDPAAGIQGYMRHQPTSDMGISFCQTEVLSKHFETANNNNNKQLDSVGQKSGGIAFHQQVNGQCSRPSFFQ